MLSAPHGAACPPQLRSTLARYLAGEISCEITLMQFALRLGTSPIAALEGLIAANPAQDRLAGLLRLAAGNADNLAQIVALAKGGLVDLPCGKGDRLRAIRDQFDAAVVIAPEASVALYSLGSANILDRATGEIVARLAEWDLLRSDMAVLDIGCGIGRIERALAPLTGVIVAIDVSPGMLAEAKRRCCDCRNVSFVQSSGRDLAAFADRSFDLLLAADTFPYLFAADPVIPQQHVRDAARLLRPGGALVILNFSYRGDDQADRRDLKQLAEETGFAVRVAGSREFELWDGLAFLLTLPARRE